MDEFLDRMSEVLGVPVTNATRFRDVPNWSSLVGFGVLVSLENDFGRRMDIAEFSTLSTVGELAEACGIGERGV